ncbi:uncharacterized protein [Eurosta solidaginis]|uniref:uncharacterized protein n=1 Tax=Eurosta solidaginis TaxID=178769 RepID=UPI0035316715
MVQPQQKLPIVPQPTYFAVGPQPHEVTCPYCQTTAKTVMLRPILRCFSRRHYCAECGEYLGTYRRPQL